MKCFASDTGLDRGGLQGVADFLVHAQDIGELEIASLVLERARAAAADEAAAPSE